MNTPLHDPACPLCADAAGRLVWQAADWRVVAVEGPEAERFPGFYRLIWNAHVAEFSDLTAAQRSGVMDAVALIEQVLREQLQPDKINLASLGNVVPHLHWHVIPRWRDDSHFPNPIWGQALRAVPARPVDAVALDAALAQRLENASR